MDSKEHVRPWLSLLRLFAELHELDDDEDEDDAEEDVNADPAYPYGDPAAPGGEATYSTSSHEEP